MRRIETWLVLLMLTLTLRSGIILSVSALQDSRQTIRSSGTIISRNPISLYYGFAARGTDFWEVSGGRWKREYFQQIKQWGFNCILAGMWWTDYESKDGSYHEGRLQAIRDGVNIAHEEGIEVILSLRVCIDPSSSRRDYKWDGVNLPVHDYANGVGDYSTGEGRTRYINFVKKVAGIFYDCPIVPWHMPYHHQSCTVGSTAYNTWHQTTFPLILEAIRDAGNNKPVVFVPIHQHPKYYKTATPFDDANIIYGVGHLCPWEVVDYGNWDYDTDYFDDPTEGLFPSIKHWKDTYGLPMMSVEYIGLMYNTGETIHQSRLDCAEYSLRKMIENVCGWTYWRISLLSSHGSDNVIRHGNLDEIQPQILALLQECKVS